MPSNLLSILTLQVYPQGHINAVVCTLGVIQKRITYVLDLIVRHISPAELREAMEVFL